MSDVKPKLYLNGCSFMAGVGVDYKDSLPGLFIRSGKYEVIDHSRGAQSNPSIALDLQKHLDDFDIYIIAWSFAPRFYLRTNGKSVDFIPCSVGAVEPLTKEEDDLTQVLHKAYYALYDDAYHNELSDMLVTNAYDQLHRRSKRIIFMEWDISRKVPCPIFRPKVPHTHYLPDRHFNEAGLKLIYDQLEEILNETD